MRFLKFALAIQPNRNEMQIVLPISYFVFLSKSKFCWALFKVYIISLSIFLGACWLTHSRLTPSFRKCSQGLEDKAPIIDKKAKDPWIILVQKLFQSVDRK